MRQSNQNKRLFEIAAKIPEPKAAWQRRPRVAGKLRIIAVAERIEWTQRVIDEPAIPDAQRERLINITASLPKILEELFSIEQTSPNENLTEEQVHRCTLQQR